MKTSDLI